MHKGLGQEVSTSTVELNIEPGPETDSRDGSLGGTREINTEEGVIETSMMSFGNQTGDSSCPLWLKKVWDLENAKRACIRNIACCCSKSVNLVQQELEDAEFIPMPEESELPTLDPLSSVSETDTRPYEELKELKAAAEAVSSQKGLSVRTSLFSRMQTESYNFQNVFHYSALRTVSSSFIVSV